MNRAQSAADHLPFDERRLRTSARSPGGAAADATGSVMQGLIGAANQDHNLARVFSTFTATNPSIFLDMDRDKAQALGVGVSGIFDALNATLGGFFINDFHLYGRTWQVNLQGEDQDRRDLSSIWQIYVRSKMNQMVPLQ